MSIALDNKLNIEAIRDWIGEAGDVARHYFGHVLAEWKGIGDPVTAADREIERLLTARIQDAHPDRQPDAPAT